MKAINENWIKESTLKMFKKSAVKQASKHDQYEAEMIAKGFKKVFLPHPCGKGMIQKFVKDDKQIS